MHFGATTPESGEPPLPFDPRTAMLDLWRRRWILAIGYAACIAVSLFGAIKLGKRVFEAETSLMFVRGDEDDSESGSELLPTPSMSTQLHMVKLPTNLKIARERLELLCNPRTFASSISVKIQRDTALMFIRTTWGDQEGVAEIANTVRDVFLESTIEFRKELATGYVENVSSELAGVEARLEDVDGKLAALQLEHDTVDLDLEARSALKDYRTVDTQLEDARIERVSLDLQIGDVRGILGELQRQVKDETEAPQDAESAATARMRAERLSDRIDEERRLREDRVKVDKLSRDYERMKELREEGVISEGELETARAALDEVLARVEEGTEVEAMRVELEQLDEVIASQAVRQTPAENLLNEMLLRSFDLRLKRAAIDDRISMLETRLEGLRGRVDRLPVAQREFVKLKRASSVLTKERNDLGVMLAEASALQRLEDPDFLVLTDAKKPTFPVHSNRRLVAIGLAIVTGTLFTFLVVGWTLLDSRLRSAREVRLRTSRSVIGEIPFARGVEPHGDDPRVDEPIRVIASGVARALGANGAPRILVTSAFPVEGVTLTAARLATALARREGGVTLVDASGGDPSGSVASAHENVEILSGEADSASIRERLNEATEPVVVDAPPILVTSAAIALTDRVDGAVLVLRAGHTRASGVRRAIDRLEVAGIPVIGIVMNGVERIYAEDPPVRVGGRGLKLPFLGSRRKKPSKVGSRG